MATTRDRLESQEHEKDRAEREMDTEHLMPVVHLYSFLIIFWFIFLVNWLSALKP